jgi:hypothetical protein
VTGCKIIEESAVFVVTMGSASSSDPWYLCGCAWERNLDRASRFVTVETAREAALRHRPPRGDSWVWLNMGQLAPDLVIRVLRGGWLLTVEFVDGRR